MAQPPLHIVILAAGKGSRLKSSTPKVMHTIAGKTLLERIVETAQACSPEQISVVIGHAKDRIREQHRALPVQWIEQREPLGTGDAVATALSHINVPSRVLVLFGDTPLVEMQTLQKLLSYPAEDVGIITSCPLDPTGLGRVVMQEGTVTKIVEHVDASEHELAINTVFSGLMCAPSGALKRWLKHIDNDNKQQEYYLTAVVPLAIQDGVTIHCVNTGHDEVSGVNTQMDRAKLERWWQLKEAKRLMQAGVRLEDPARLDVRGEVNCGQDVCIDVNVICEGTVECGDRVSIGPNVVLKHVVLGDDVTVLGGSILEGAVIKAGATIGPFARIRPGTTIEEQAKVGNFVEVKNTTLGAGSKVSHLSYLGDAQIGQSVNIGAGVITCNYDGVNKHVTKIFDNAFIGSNTALVAPITIGDSATVGAGSTLTKSAPAKKLTLSRAKQLVLDGWKRPTKTQS